MDNNNIFKVVAGILLAATVIFLVSRLNSSRADVNNTEDAVVSRLNSSGADVNNTEDAVYQLEQKLDAVDNHRLNWKRGGITTAVIAVAGVGNSAWQYFRSMPDLQKKYEQVRKENDDKIKNMREEMVKSHNAKIRLYATVLASLAFIGAIIYYNFFMPKVESNQDLGYELL